MFTKLKKIGGEYILNKEFKKNHRSKFFQNINDIKSIAILFNINNEEEYKNILKIAKTFRAEKKTVYIVSFVNEKVIPNYITPTINFDVITLKNLNFFNIPKNNFINDFINNEYDLLIDLSNDNNFIFKYLIALSKAKLKIGDFSEEKKFYLDLMIKNTDKKDVKLFVENIKHYLTVLKKI